MQDIKNIYNVYFVGVGGIGMSAIARYFKSLGKNVAGYDKVSKPLTSDLLNEGIKIHFEDDIKNIPLEFLKKENTLIVYTPAIPKDNKELNYFLSNGFEVKKRSEVLGILTKSNYSLAVAGTHGKTTISTMLAHLLKQSRIGGNAFLGGISKNYKTNFLIDPESKYMVIEADEFDRSFLQLYPKIAVISAVDADHLDIYDNRDNVVESFRQFTNQIASGGTLLIKKGIDFLPAQRDDIKIYTYSIKENADFTAQNIRLENGLYIFDFVGPIEKIDNLKLGIPGLLNVENAVAAITMALLAGVKDDEIFNSLGRFKGIQRRFDIQINSDKIVYIDDYAHHPEELKAAIMSAKQLFKHKKITGVFQPHLFTRTRDFACEFAKSLDLLDEVILLNIYPAREEPIEGVTSEIIFKNIKNKNKTLCSKSELLNVLSSKKPKVLITMGAGDIDEFVEPIKSMYLK
ncbi:MAG: UDP-N-acetylmuramate--L-alanine ligase [Bacteroidetes bacterium GWF2_33_16]|nr:MAG: UDP-N-acetylmuramate--L-alanine ligase [Bacteroidetes bacterium GWE2_32_14]OFY08569.1 MAG: UDP-N-acetylmuramate--L-alanine ligase [Bacteroidetes bacterium GWF2_33_16]